MDLLSSVVNWPFMNEPLYRWGIFLVALSAMGVALNGLHDLMRE